MTRRSLIALLAVLLAAMPVWAAAPASPTTASGTLAEGTRWATPYYSRQADAPGPTVLVVGGIHGNEPAGALAAGQIRHW
ncbi:MAG: hypothetical protein U9R68_01235, partial [Planctomycetota bacterium]|nr:hypothetical protein [Planctomycetota bacterium]